MGGFYGALRWLASERARLIRTLEEDSFLCYSYQACRVDIGLKGGTVDNHSCPCTFSGFFVFEKQAFVGLRRPFHKRNEKKNTFALHGAKIPITKYIVIRQSVSNGGAETYATPQSDKVCHAELISNHRL
jgi:hypothetical protein